MTNTKETKMKAHRMNTRKLKKLNIVIPDAWDYIGRGLKILEDRKEEIIEDLNKSHPNRCRSCDGRAIDLRVSCECCTPDESHDSLWLNPLDFTERLSEDERVNISPSHSDIDLPQQLKDLMLINELISEEKQRLYKEDEREEERKLHYAKVEECYAIEMIEWTGLPYMP